MLRKLLLVLATLAALAASLAAPARAQVVSPYEILRNSVSNLHAEGDTLWAGPYLNLTTDGGRTWLVADADSVYSVLEQRVRRNRVFSLDVEGRTVLAGLGYSGEEGTPSAGGFTVSTDGGATFAYRFPPLDAPTDTSVVYGATTLPAFALIQPEQSPPYDTDVDAARGIFYSANFFAGLRRSVDGGLSWQRVVLPPDFIPAISPGEDYSGDSLFIVGPRFGGVGQFNHMAFSVLVDETGTVWAGTLYGVNRSFGEPDATGALAWRRTRFDGSSRSLTGSWVVSIEEQPLEGARNPVWMATWPSDQIEGLAQLGVSVTRDGGETYEQHLLGERVYDFAFDESSGTVYAAAESGLFITDDGGATWRSVTRFADPDRPDRFVQRGAAVLSVATTPGAVWAGTDDGLLRSTDRGATWQLFRTEVPTNPQRPNDRAPQVDAYAYPNPFSPALADVVRIRFQQDGVGAATVRIFDFEMNLVRELRGLDESPGQREVAWDGRTSGGLRAANGTYFYVVDAPGGSGRGTILVLE
jgi:hypothetical protein